MLYGSRFYQFKLINEYVIIALKYRTQFVHSKLSNHLSKDLFSFVELFQVLLSRYLTAFVVPTYYINKASTFSEFSLIRTDKIERNKFGPDFKIFARIAIIH